MRDERRAGFALDETFLEENRKLVAQNSSDLKSQQEAEYFCPVNLKQTSSVKQTNEIMSCNEAA